MIIVIVAGAGRLFERNIFLLALCRRSRHKYLCHPKWCVLTHTCNAHIVQNKSEVDRREMLPFLPCE